MSIIALSQLIMTLKYASCTPAHSCGSVRRTRWSAWVRLNHGAAAAAAAAAAADYDVAFEVLRRRRRWIAGWLHLLVGEVITGCRNRCRMFSDTFAVNKEMKLHGYYSENRRFCSVGGPTPELGLVR